MTPTGQDAGASLKGMVVRDLQRVHMPLESAQLCADEGCNRVSWLSSRCPACGGTALITLSKVLDRRVA